MTREIQQAGKWSPNGLPLRIAIRVANLSTFPTGIINIEFDLILPNGTIVATKETNKFAEFMTLGSLANNTNACERARLALGNAVSNALLNLYQNPNFAGSGF